MSTIKKFYLCGFFLTAVCISAALFLLVTDYNPVTIESQESKTKELNSVFNEIRFIPGRNKDVWMMNQSYYGRHPGLNKWDRLAILIDKTKTPMVATFYQLQPGPLEWEENLIKKRVNYRVSCFICHNNGPRALRPLYSSPDAPLAFKDRLKIQAWNLRIKTYGRIVYNPIHDTENLKVPFAFKGSPDTDLLKVKVCNHCHKEGGFLSRGFLQRQQTTTIASLVQRGEMPPPGFRLTVKEKSELEDFLKGF